MEPPVCKNIRSRRHPDQRCVNPATNGEYCGVHAKHPRPFQTKTQVALKHGDPAYVSIPLKPEKHIRLIQKWWLLRGHLAIAKRQGPGRWNRSICTNDTDFYSMEDIASISGEYLFSFADTDKIVYAFDIRSIASLIEKCSEGPLLNPYNRQAISDEIVSKAAKYIRWCRKKGIDTRWAPVAPATPDQRFQMKVTDLFQKIDELNYYTNPSWFINLSADDLRCFYVELYDIWHHRAELSIQMRNTIIPSPARPFKYAVREVVTQKSQEILRKISMDIIRMFISAAEDKSDRTLGAMYVMTALTLVCRACAETYPWLYESATPGIYNQYRQLHASPQLPFYDGHTMNFINAIMHANYPVLQPMPVLLLGPPAAPQPPAPEQ